MNDEQEALVEAAAHTLAHHVGWPSYREHARAIIPMIWASATEAERERCAKVADHLSGWGNDCGKGGHAAHIAAAIRALPTGGDDA